MRAMTASCLLPMAVFAWSDATPPDPREDPWLAVPELRALMEWVTFRTSFDAESFVPDMAAGPYKMTVQKQPAFEPGLRGSALVAGTGSGNATCGRGANAPFATRGAVSMWICPVEWTHVTGGNTTLLMTSNSTFYVQRQGPMHREDGSVQRQEGLQFLMLSKVTGNQCLMHGTRDWPPGEWRLIVANWNWPSMSLSLDGGEFSHVTVKENPTDDLFGPLVIGASGGEKTLMDELTIYRRPLTRGEAKLLYDTFRPAQED